LSKHYLNQNDLDKYYEKRIAGNDLSIPANGQWYLFTVNFERHFARAIYPM
jgi:hypothetical protein